MRRDFPINARQFSKALIIGLIAIFPSQISAQKPTLAIMDFEAYGISQTEAQALTNRLLIELFQHGTFQVVERGLMESILTEQDFQLAGCTSDECLVEVGRLIGATQILGGSISKVGNTFSVATRLVSVETGLVVNVAAYDHEGDIDDLLKSGMKYVAAELAKYVGGGTPLESRVIPLETRPLRTAPRVGIIKGLKAGLNLSGIEGISSGLSGSGLSLGGFIDYPLLNHLSLAFEMLYSVKGFSYEGEVILNYLDIPVLGVFSYDNRAIFFIGPYLSLLLQGFTVVDGEKISMSSELVTHLDYGMTFGASYSLGKLIFEARYSSGFAPVFTVSDIENNWRIEDYMETRNVLMQLLLGYTL